MMEITIGIDFAKEKFDVTLKYFEYSSINVNV